MATSNGIRQILRVLRVLGVLEVLRVLDGSWVRAWLRVRNL